MIAKNREYRRGISKGLGERTAFRAYPRSRYKGVNRAAFLLLSENGRGFLKDKDIRFRIKTQGYGI